MISIKVKGLKELQAELKDLSEHRIKSTTAIALTETAVKLKARLIKEMKIVFDRPVNWTLDSLFDKSATPSNLNAHVWFKDERAMGSRSNTKGGAPAAKYLQAEVHGGGRSFKGFERALQRAGLLPPGHYAMPGEGVRLDSYGNIPRQMLVKILSAAKAAETVSGYTMNQSARSRKRPGAFSVFVGRPGVGLKKMSKTMSLTSALLQQAEAYKSASSKYPLGIWERTPGRGLIPLIIFVKKPPRYGVRLPFYDISQRFVDIEFPKIFGRLADETLAFHKGKVKR
jgi:hypothetical protein